MPFSISGNENGHVRINVKLRLARVTVSDVVKRYYILHNLYAPCIFKAQPLTEMSKVKVTL
jgi:hypothetical protein